MSKVRVGKLFRVSSLIGAGMLSALSISTPVEAHLKGFNAGNIMSDYVMSNKDTMTEAQIQNFLKSKNPCNDTDYAKYQKYTAQGYAYNWRDGHFVCMVDESFNGESAAHIIWKVAQEYSINPQVLIVLLQKEQSLVTDTWPNSRQYEIAVGYGCPDTAPCDPSRYGFENQLRWAARLFREVLSGGWSNYPAYSTVHVGYNPIDTCGGSDIYIENYATSALYRYTPYQPNAYALSGGSDSSYPNCGAFGNRNFYDYFTNWFGDTQDNGFRSLETPRWMQVKNTTTKVAVFGGDSVGETLEVGRQLHFIDKIFVNDKWYLRTEYNYLDGGAYGIEQENLEEIPYAQVEPKWVTLKTDGNRSHPASRTSIGDRLVRGTVVKVVDQIIIDGNIYYRTEFNHDGGGDYGIHSRFLEDGVSPIDLEGSRNFCSLPSAYNTDIQSGDAKPIPLKTLFINKKILLNSAWLFQAKSDNGTAIFVASDLLSEGSCAQYVAFDGPRNMRILKDAYRFNPFTNERYDILATGRIVHFSSKIFLNGQWYYRTTLNTQQNFDAVVPASSVGDY